MKVVVLIAGSVLSVASPHIGKHVLGSVGKVLGVMLTVVVKREKHTYENPGNIRKVLSYIANHAVYMEASEFAHGSNKRPLGGFMGFKKVSSSLNLAALVKPFWGVVTVDKEECSVVHITYPRWVRMPWERPMKVSCGDNDEDSDTLSNRLDTMLDDDDNGGTVGLNHNKRVDELGYKAWLQLGNQMEIFPQHSLLLSAQDRETYRFAIEFANAHLKNLLHGPAGDEFFNGRLLLYGRPGLGKSTIATVLSQMMGGALMRLQPSMPGTATLATIMCCALEKPLVVLVDEADVLLRNVNGEKLSQTSGKHIRMVHDKVSWNDFMDAMKHTKNIVVILTMNSVPAAMLDPQLSASSHHWTSESGSATSPSSSCGAPWSPSVTPASPSVKPTSTLTSSTYGMRLLDIDPSLVRGGRISLFSEIYRDDDEQKLAYRDYTPYKAMEL